MRSPSCLIPLVWLLASCTSTPKLTPSPQQAPAVPTVTWSDAHTRYIYQRARVRFEFDACANQECSDEALKKVERAIAWAEAGDLDKASAILHATRVSINETVVHKRTIEPLPEHPASDTLRQPTLDEAEHFCHAVLCDHLEREAYRDAREAYAAGRLDRARTIYVGLMAAYDAGSDPFASYLAATDINQRAGSMNSTVSKILGPMACHPKDEAQCKEAWDYERRGMQLLEEAQALYIATEWEASRRKAAEALDLLEAALEALPATE